MFGRHLPPWEGCDGGGVGVGWGGVGGGVERLQPQVVLSTTRVTRADLLCIQCTLIDLIKVMSRGYVTGVMSRGMVCPAWTGGLDYTMADRQ